MQAGTSPPSANVDRTSARADLYRAVVEHSLDLIFVLDGAGACTYAGPSAARHCDRPDDDFVGRRLADDVHDYDRGSFEDVLDHARRFPGESVRIEDLRLKRSDGTWLHCEGSCIGMLNEQSVQGIIISLRDITRRRRAENWLRKFKAIADAACYGALMTDLDGNILYLNRACAELHRRDPADLIGGNISTFHSPEQMAEVEDLHARLAREGSLSAVEAWHVRSDGETFPILLNAMMMCDDSGEGEFISATLVDITERKEAEQDVRRLNKALRRRVAEGTERLEQAQSDLIESKKMAALGGLVAGVAHEINTPVGVGVTAASHLVGKFEHYRRLFESGKLRRSDFMTLLQVGEEASRMIQSNLRRAAELVQSFKQVAADQSSEAQRRMELRDYLADILLSLRPQLKQKNVDVVLECPEGIVLDSHPGAISQIVTNLVMNSLVHAFPGGGAGNLALRADVRDGSLRLEFEDDGRGMEREERERVFEPFFTTRRGEGGCGLGMAVVYSLVTGTLGGTIRCISAPGEGTGYVVEAPVAVVGGHHPESAGRIPYGLSPAIPGLN